MPFEYPDDVELICVKGDPLTSYGLLGGSMTLPYLEPYLIRTMKEGLKHATDPQVREDMARFSAQEGKHYRQHHKLNEVVRARCGTREKLEAIERALEGDYKRFSATKSLKFNLAYGEGFEAATMNLARTLFDTDFFPRMERGPIHDLFRWHLVEELEHRTVTFEAYDHIFGSYPYRLAVGLYAQRHFFGYVKRFTDCLLEGDPEALPKAQANEAAWSEATQAGRLLARTILPRLFSTYTPWYNPRKVTMPSGLDDWSEEYTRMADQVA
jgi:hypothetical protein